jgi:hypothetical protein
LEYHKTIEGEYGCPGLSCPGVQRLIAFALKCVAAAPVPCAASPADQWQPIETAPQDWSWFLAWSADLGFLVYRSGPGLIAAEEPDPTHWMPLPTPPRATGEGARDEGMVSGRSSVVRDRVAADQHCGGDLDVADVPVAVSLDPHRLQGELLEALKSEGQKDVWIKMLSGALRNVAIGCCELPGEWEGSVADALDLIQQRLMRDDLELARPRRGHRPSGGVDG